MRLISVLIVCLISVVGTTLAAFAAGPQAEENLKPVEDVCSGARIIDGVGYKNHDSDCDKFYQCYQGEKLQDKLTVPRQCPFGQFWDQDVPTCRTASEVQCKSDKCSLRQLNSHPMDSGNCRTYWKCNLQKSVGDCCPEGQRYKKYRGCVKDTTCTDPCPGDSFHQGPCDSRPIFGDRSRYQQYVEGGVKWHNMTCPENTQYSALECGCVYHKGYSTICKPELYLPFNGNFRDYSGNKREVINHGVQLTSNGMAKFDGNSYLEIKKFLDFSKETEVTIAVRFLETGNESRLRAIVSNSIESVQPSLLILNSPSNVHTMIKRDDNGISTLHTKLNPENWNTVKLMHDENKLVLAVNEKVLGSWALGPIQDKNENLFIGKSKGFKNFKGFVDEVAVFACRPKFIQT